MPTNRVQVRSDLDPTTAVQIFAQEHLLVDTANARCSCREDEERLVEEINSHGGFAQIDESVLCNRK